MDKNSLYQFGAATASKVATKAAAADAIPLGAAVAIVRAMSGISRLIPAKQISARPISDIGKDSNSLKIAA